MKKIVICNQKMYLTKNDAYDLKNKIDNLDKNNIDLIIAPSFLNFDIFKDYKLCSQNCFYEDIGAYTGEISPCDLHLRNINYCLVGHTERRPYDTDEIINLKIKSLNKNNVTPVLCVGENKKRSFYITKYILKRQLFKALKNINFGNSEIFIAYEPSFLIGGNKTLDPEIIYNVFCYIKEILNKLNIKNYKLLYGGSINKNNIKNINSDFIDGYLIGNSSVNYLELEEIIKCIK